MRQGDYWETCWGVSSEQEEDADIEETSPRISYRTWAKYLGFAMAIVGPLAIGVTLWKVDPLSLPQPAAVSQMLIQGRIADAGLPDVPEGATDIQIRTEALAAGRMYCVSFTASAEQRKQYLSQLDVHRSYALNINKLSQVLADWLPFESGMEVQAYIVKGHELALVRVFDNRSTGQIVLYWLMSGRESNAGNIPLSPAPLAMTDSPA